MVEGADIARVVPGLALEGAERLGHRIVAPAFVNGHTHLSRCALRGLVGQSQMSGTVVEEVYFGLETSLTREDVLAFARVGAWECLLSGTGAVVDHDDCADAGAEALVDVGLCGVVAPTFQDLSGPGSDGGRPRSDHVGIAADGGLRDAGVHAAFGPHATDTVSAGLDTDRSFPGTAWVAHSAHLSQSFEELERLVNASDGDPVARLRPVLSRVSPFWCTRSFCPRGLDRLADAQVVLENCPAASTVCVPARRGVA